MAYTTPSPTTLFANGFNCMSTHTSTIFELDSPVPKFTYTAPALEPDLLQPDDHEATMSFDNRLYQLVEKLLSSSAEENTHLLISQILTQTSLDVSGLTDSLCLIFTPDASKVLRPRDCDQHNMDLVAFWGTRAEAEKVVNQGWMPTVPSVYQIVSAAELETTGRAQPQPLRYAFLLTRHKPATSTQYVLAINKKRFCLISAELDTYKESMEMPWGEPGNPSFDDALQRLRQCVKMIHEEASMASLTPNLSMVLKSSSADFALFTLRAGDVDYSLLPLLSGRGSGRKAFVALGVNPALRSETHIFKLSWQPTVQKTTEFDILRKIHPDGIVTPGVVRLNSRLSSDTPLRIVSPAQSDSTSLTREQRLLVLDTIGHPLSSCKTVLEFLEVMYDLLEVLRFLVAERKILHRDISWANVLIRPQHVSGGRDVRPVPSTATTGTHTYRFISDIFNEETFNVRVALSDFDNAVDLENKDEVDKLSYGTGTPMFMAGDVLSPRNACHMCHLPSNFASDIGNAILQTAVCNKYASSDEADCWNEFYSNKLKHICFIDADQPEQTFRHSAVHDAESVYFLCLLFFTRMRPLGQKNDAGQEKARIRSDMFTVLARKEIGWEFPRTFKPAGVHPRFSQMLDVLNKYLWIPWYNVKGVERGDIHEFHLHDTMQRFLLKEITAIRNNEALNIAVDTKPLYVYVFGLTGNSSRSSLVTINRLEQALHELEQPDLYIDTNDVSKYEKDVDEVVYQPGLRVPEKPFNSQHSTVPSHFWEILREKKDEKRWVTASNKDHDITTTSS